MNNKTSRNTYVTVEFFEATCPQGWHHHPGHSKSRKDGCMKDTDMSGSKEAFGAFSLSSAVRYPYSPGYFNPNYVQPKIPGVN